MEIREKMLTLNDALYKALHSGNRLNRDYENGKKLWDKAKLDTSILEEAIKIKNDRFDRTLFSGLSIVDCMLIDYENINKDLYMDLTNKIYGNVELARIVMDGFSNGGYSFLLMSLWNTDFNLTDEQKEFAISEAMNTIGTTKAEKLEKEYIAKLDNCEKLKDDPMVNTEVGPMGAKTANKWMYNIMNSLSTTQAHGVGAYDIRYWILKNPSFTNEEKKQYVFDFYADSESWDRVLDELRNDVSYPEGADEIIDSVFFVTDKQLIDMFGNDRGKKLVKEVSFIKNLHEYRPSQWEG